MKRQEKADKIAQILEELYPDPPVPLDHKDPFTLMIAVLLSAQTTDKKVNEVTPDLFALADNPFDMRHIPVAEIQKIIRQIGLAPQKAKSIHNLCHRLCDVFNGIVPQNLEDLESLAGVGHKTASVVLSQAFGIPAFAVDTHIHRLAARWGLSNGHSVQKTETDLKKLFPKEIWNDIHIQIIYFGREYCPARRHDLTICPICSWTATKKKIAEEVEMNRPKSRSKKK